MHNQVLPNCKKGEFSQESSKPNVVLAPQSVQNLAFGLITVLQTHLFSVFDDVSLVDETDFRVVEGDLAVVDTVMLLILLE